MQTESNPDQPSNSFTKQLNSLFEVYLAIKIQYECSNPKNEYSFKDPYFLYLQLETTKVILGRLIILLMDKKDPRYKTISFTLLINDVLSSSITLQNTQRTSLAQILSEISEKKSIFADFRDKHFAHIELEDDDSLKTFSFTYKDVNDLLELAKKSYDTLFLILTNNSSDHMQRQIDSLSSKLWKLYVDEGLVEKVIK